MSSDALRSWLCRVVPLKIVCGFGWGVRCSLGGFSGLHPLPLPVCNIGLTRRSVLPQGAMGAGCRLRLGLQLCWRRLILRTPRELSLHPGIRFWHLFPSQRGNIVRSCSSKLSVSLSPWIGCCGDSFSKEHKQTPESNFLTLGCVPGSYIPHCLVQLVLSYCPFQSQSNAQLV